MLCPPRENLLRSVENIPQHSYFLTDRVPAVYCLRTGFGTPTTVSVALQ